MARAEADREDLLREATALVERAELAIQGEDRPVVIGFRREGAVSIYVGQDTVIQFDSRGQIRRGYQAGRLIKATRGRLASLVRVRRENEVQLVCHDLDEAETTAYLQSVQQHLDRLQEALSQQRFSIRGQVPPGAGVVNRVLTWLTQRPRILQVAHTPRVL
jgi:hypothetical protein